MFSYLPLYYEIKKAEIARAKYALWVKKE